MTFHRAAMFGIFVSVAIAAAAGSVHAQASAPGCTDGSVMVTAAVALPVMPVEDLQWCVDSDDPRCSADPAGAPAAHLAHAGDAGQLASEAVVRHAPVAVLARTDREHGFAASAHRGDLERPPRAG